MWEEQHVRDNPNLDDQNQQNLWEEQHHVVFLTNCCQHARDNPNLNI